MTRYEINYFFLYQLTVFVFRKVLKETVDVAEADDVADADVAVLEADRVNKGDGVNKTEAVK